MLNNKYQILVLSDLKKTTNCTLQTTVELAKMIQGNIEFFHVQKPTDVISSESQLSAVRNINQEYIKTDKKIKNLLEPISKNHDFNVSYRYAFGNVKDEIEGHITKMQPDVIVLGRRKGKAISFIGDNITEFILKKFSGAIIIASEENAFESNSNLSLGILNDIEDSLNINFAQNLIAKTETPLKSFRIGNKRANQSMSDLIKDKKIVEYIFEDNSNAINTISDYVSKNNVNLLCIDRGTGNSKKESYAKTAISRMNVSLLVT
ncbi:universal stress protein [Winogradskyella sp. PE311]|uniref:universal stress protein n=1 Tax=Winogradskyella sp. PE311 TaxID=3366943 RepID=UPI0039804AFE